MQTLCIEHLQPPGCISDAIKVCKGLGRQGMGLPGAPRHMRGPALLSMAQRHMAHSANHIIFSSQVVSWSSFLMLLVCQETLCHLCEGGSPCPQRAGADARGFRVALHRQLSLATSNLIKRSMHAHRCRHKLTAHLRRLRALRIPKYPYSESWWLQ